MYIYVWVWVWVVVLQSVYRTPNRLLSPFFHLFFFYAGRSFVLQAGKAFRRRGKKAPVSPACVFMTAASPVPIGLGDLPRIYPLQAAYHGLLQMFLTRRALFLVVCDAKEFGLRSGRLTDEQQARQDLRKLEEMGVCDWLKCLAWRVPGCDVVLVGTKCDLLPRDKVKDVATRIERGCRMWLERDAPYKINIEAGVSMTSCKQRAGEGRGKERRSGPLPSLEDCMGGFGGTFCMGRRTKDHQSWPCDVIYDGSGDTSRTSLPTRITKTHESKANRGASMLIPRGWDIALTVIEALSAGR